VVRRVLALEIKRAHEAPAHLERIRFHRESGTTGVDCEIDRAGKSAPARRALRAKRPEPVDVGGLPRRLGGGSEAGRRAGRMKRLARRRTTSTILARLLRGGTRTNHEVSPWLTSLPSLNPSLRPSSFRSTTR